MDKQILIDILESNNDIKLVSYIFIKLEMFEPDEIKLAYINENNYLITKTYKVSEGKAILQNNKKEVK